MAWSVLAWGKEKEAGCLLRISESRLDKHPTNSNVTIIVNTKNSLQLICLNTCIKSKCFPEVYVETFCSGVVLGISALLGFGPTRSLTAALQEPWEEAGKPREAESSRDKSSDFRSCRFFWRGLGGRGTFATEFLQQVQAPSHSAGLEESTTPVRPWPLQRHRSGRPAQSGARRNTPRQVSGSSELGMPSKYECK